MKINYYAFAHDKSHAVDKRRFYIWAHSLHSSKHDVSVYTLKQEVNEGADVTIVSASFDLYKFLRRNWPTGGGKKVLQLVDGYGLYKEKWLRDFTRGIIKYLKGELSRPVFSYSALIRKAIKKSDAVICASPEQSLIIQKLNSRVVFLPDNHSFLQGKVKPSPCQSNEVNLLWEGLPESLDALFALKYELGKIKRGMLVNLSVVTNLKGYRVGGKFFEYDVEKLVKKHLAAYVTTIRFYRWSEEELLKAASASNIAVLPVNTSSALHMLKHESRLLLYWQLGIPVVSSNIPSYIRLANQANLSNLIFETPEQFSENILWLSKADNWLETTVIINEFISRFHSKEVFETNWDEVIEFVIASNQNSN